MKDLADMTVGELEDHLTELKEDLDEIEEERIFVLSQTGLHVSAGAVRNYETEINALRARMDEAERVIHAKRTK